MFSQRFPDAIVKLRSEWNLENRFTGGDSEGQYSSAMTLVDFAFEGWVDVDVSEKGAQEAVNAGRPSDSRHCCLICNVMKHENRQKSQ